MRASWDEANQRVGPRSVRVAHLLLTAIACAAGCAYRVTPPIATSVREPVSVFIVDHGKHAALVLPGRDDAPASASPTSIEYAFGEYRWFALNDDALVRAPGVMLGRSAGALGRTERPVPATLVAVRQESRAEAVHEVRVERASVMALRSRLDARFAAGTDRVENPLVGLTLVRDPEPYGFGRSCNDAVAAWLRELGCRVNGASPWAEFVVAR